MRPVVWYCFSSQLKEDVETERVELLRRPNWLLERGSALGRDGLS
jgi:hypothetical protein